MADDLENEDSTFLEKFTSSSSWLKSNCAKRIFCSFVTLTLGEEKRSVQKLQENAHKSEDVETYGQLQSRQERHFLEKEINYIEDLINTWLDR